MFCRPETCRPGVCLALRDCSSRCGRHEFCHGASHGRLTFAGRHVTLETACAIFRSRRYREFDRAATAIVGQARGGLSEAQIELLGRSIAGSGERVDLPASLGPFVDVASSGGPASLTTLLCPLLVAAFGFHVPKLSATGSVAGGIDTMAVIPGFKTNLSDRGFLIALRRSRFAHIEPNKAFCPADNNLIRKRRAANMMANAELATASLLAKKLATPKTSALFDFRVGPAGNIGDNVLLARRAKQLFLRVAGRIGLHVDVVLTENRFFPCSALGRMESLFLLWQILSNRNLLQIDKNHLSLCIEISARACQLADARLSSGKTKQILKQLLRSGSVKKLFLSHLLSQGAKSNSFAQVLRARASQQTVIIRSGASGYWHPPNLSLSKEWLKSEQNRVARLQPHRKPFETPLGLRLCQTPGRRVRRGDIVVEVRCPTSVPALITPPWLAGNIRRSPRPSQSPQLLN